MHKQMCAYNYMEEKTLYLKAPHVHVWAHSTTHITRVTEAMMLVWDSAWFHSLMWEEGFYATSPWTVSRSVIPDVMLSFGENGEKVKICMCVLMRALKTSSQSHSVWRLHT